MREIHLFLMNIKGAIQEADHIGLEQEKIELERRAKEREQEKERGRVQQQVLDKVADMPEPNTKASTASEQPATSTLVVASADKKEVAKEEAEDESLASNSKPL